MQDFRLVQFIGDVDSVLCEVRAELSYGGLENEDKFTYKMTIVLHTFVRY